MKKGKYVRSEEIKKKNSLSKVGHITTEDTKKKISASLTGRKIAQSIIDKVTAKNTGSKRTLEQRKKMSISHMGENNPNWKGGLNKKPYPMDWNETLKRSIRERDRYTCQLCSCQQGDIAHAVHHIDYNKQNCNPDNLITLCNKCHIKTNYKRNYWKEYFQGIMVN